MNAETAQALRTINRSFYRDCAQAFSRTRSRPWSGFERVLAHCARQLTVLDVGCGNGRFAQALGACPGDGPRVRGYVGVDESPELLEIGRRLALPFPAHFWEHDILDPGLPWGTARYALVAAFGVMHHIPGRGARRTLVERLGGALAAEGLLALSFFRCERSPRIMGRLVSPHQLLPAAHAADTEPGDFLMPFGHTGRFRYCHRFDDRELDAFSALEGLRVVARFASDGPVPLNDYLLLQRCTATGT